MVNNNNTYNQPLMEPEMPPELPMPMSRRARMGQRMIKGARRMQDIFPRWLSIYPIVTYILVLMVMSLMYSEYSLPWYYVLSGVIAVLVFFLYGNTMLKNMSVVRMSKERVFEKRLFIYSLLPRLLLTLFMYWIFMVNYGDAFGFENGDALFYHDLGVGLSQAISDGEFDIAWQHNRNVLDISDMGYATYVGLIYRLTDNNILIVRLIKCLLSSWTVLLIYRLAKRNFGEQTARMTAIFCALWPNFWYYSSSHLKETEMVFLAVLFFEQADQMLRSRQFTAWKVIPILLIAAAMFTFRTILGIVALMSLVFAIVISSSKVVSWGKRIIVGILAVALIGVVAGDRIQEQTRDLLEQVQEGNQQKNMEWRGIRENGNAFAKYAGAAVFAPMIFTLPFPTLVKPYDGQDMQMILNGGNFVKNITSSFTILALVMLLMSGKWREHLLPLSFMLGYAVVLAFSTFAQSERFHQPIMPFELMFAAYGLSIAVTKPKYKRWFGYWCGLMFIAAIAWNWFKLAGRGLV